MARPLSEEKRAAILASAAELVAEIGTGAPTAGIARRAGVSEGTLFTYFATKDELLNQLYLEIEADLAKALLEDFPTRGEPRERARRVWDRFVGWGAANPARHRALRQLKVSERITQESRRCGETSFGDLKTLLEESLAGHVGPDRPMALVHAVLGALAETTITLIAQDPAHAADHLRSGFEIFWKGIGR